MKREYETPSVEKIEFDYTEQVVAQSGDPVGQYYQRGKGHCDCGVTSDGAIGSN